MENNGVDSKTSNNRLLSIFDPENGSTHKLIVSNDDYSRATTDESFVNALLFHARVNSGTNRNINIVENTDVTLAETEVSLQNQDLIENEIYEIENDDHLLESEIIVAGSSKTIYTWGYDQTVMLINSMSTHFDDLNHPKKRKNVFDLIANDLISGGYKVNSVMIQNKWKSLMKSYKKAKDTRTRTGQSPARFMFFQLMDDFLGNRPTNACQHSLNSNDLLTENIPPSMEKSDSCSEESISNENNISVKKTSGKRFREIYLTSKQEEYNKRQRRHAERMEIEKEKVLMEKKKIEILEKYINCCKNK